LSFSIYCIRYLYNTPNIVPELYRKVRMCGEHYVIVTFLLNINL
jgi:hypothetical protein